MNYSLADFVNRINNAILGHLSCIIVLRTDLNLRVLAILYRQGVIRGFHVVTGS